MGRRVFQNLRMTLESNNGHYQLDFGVASGHADFSVLIKLTEADYSVIDSDIERAAFLQAAFHHPFQLRETRLSEEEQRIYLDSILHAPKNVAETFLTEKNRGRANGAIAHMASITLDRDIEKMRKGKWFLT